MRGLDPSEEEDTSPAPSTQAVDASASPIHDAWSKWTSSPANNAALLQFGIAMLQPHAPGQSQLGAAANALGEAGGASSRVQLAESEDEKRQAEIEDKKSQAAARTVAGQAAMINAKAYERGMDIRAANPKGVSGELAIQKQFNSWLAKPEDTTGLQVDPLVGALAKTHPEIKTKADLLANPQAMREAYRMFKQTMVDPTDVGDGSVPAVGGAAPPAPSFTPRVAKDKNGKTWTESSPGVFKDEKGKLYQP